MGVRTPYNIVQYVSLFKGYNLDIFILLFGISYCDFIDSVFYYKLFRIIKFIDQNHANLAVSTMNGAEVGFKGLGLKVRLDRK